jgi:hypothetical protein
MGKELTHKKAERHQHPVDLCLEPQQWPSNIISGSSSILHLPVNQFKRTVAMFDEIPLFLHPHSRDSVNRDDRGDVVQSASFLVSRQVQMHIYTTNLHDAVIELINRSTDQSS